MRFGADDAELAALWQNTSGVSRSTTGLTIQAWTKPIRPMRRIGG
jgi:hypothetical protein